MHFVFLGLSTLLYCALVVFGHCNAVILILFVIWAWWDYLNRKLTFSFFFQLNWIIFFEKYVVDCWQFLILVLEVAWKNSRTWNFASMDLLCGVSDIVTCFWFLFFDDIEWLLITSYLIMLACFGGFVTFPFFLF